MIRVLLADDQALVRSGFRLILERDEEISVVGEAANGDEYVFEAIRAGASGFLLKDVLPVDLLHAVQLVHRGEAMLAPSLTRRLLEEFLGRPRSHDRASTPFAELTERELQVARAVSRGLSNAEIGKELFLSEATVKTHVTRVLAKLGVRDRVQIVVVAYESGLIQPGANR